MVKKKKEAFVTENFSSKELEEIDSPFKSTGVKIKSNDKYEELDCEDENEASCEEDLEEEGLDVVSEERKHYDQEEISENSQARQNIKDNAQVNIKKKKK